MRKPGLSGGGQTSNARIAVFNHSSSILFLFDSILTELGYEVSTYLQPAESVESLRSFPPDLIILGYITGHSVEEIDAIRHLRQDVRVAHVPVIVATTAPELVAQRIQANAFTSVKVLGKPFSFSGLVNVVQSILDEP
jgi:CheY-like chemotaxis protein